MSKDFQRRYRVVLEVEGDTWKDAERELIRVAEHAAEHGPDCDMTSGGYSTGAIIRVTEDPEMTHDRYVEMLRKRTREKFPTPPPNLLIKEDAPGPPPSVSR